MNRISENWNRKCTSINHLVERNLPRHLENQTKDGKKDQLRITTLKKFCISFLTSLLCLHCRKFIQHAILKIQYYGRAVLFILLSTKIYLFKGGKNQGQVFKKTFICLETKNKNVLPSIHLSSMPASFSSSGLEGMWHLLPGLSGTE